VNWSIPDIAPPCEETRQRARERQVQLTKPPGSLGLLEELGVRLAAMQGSVRPVLDRVSITVFAADHGVAAEGVSAFPKEVTREMLRNFVQGGAAISVLARELNARLEVVDVGVILPLEDSRGLVLARVGAGTANFVLEPAMTKTELIAALRVGAEAATRARVAGAQLFIGGEMGIGNTTAASSMACALLNASPKVMVGPGTGLNKKGMEHKRAVVAASLALHGAALDGPLETLRRLGGFEIAALVGAYLYAAAGGLPVLVDGFIASVAALLAVRLHPACADWLIYAHRSAEPGHRLVLKALQARPILDLSMRLGEGSGAAMAVPILRAACALHREMATFEEAGIPTR
jgi:nicotinate-nucleotide--dimethylbenzimidazole phosphoribosyltransferase